MVPDYCLHLLNHLDPFKAVKHLLKEVTLAVQLPTAATTQCLAKALPHCANGNVVMSCGRYVISRWQDSQCRSQSL